MQGGPNIFIAGCATISPQRTFDGAFLPEALSFSGNTLTCQVPDFKAYIPPAQLRRLSRMLRIGLTTSILCLRNSGIESPGGIITATGYGFLDETEKFLRELLERGERQLTPTYFMQSTYNALAGLIGLSLTCTGYNNTYVSKGYALGSALDDAVAQLQHDPSQTMLVGAYDEAAAVQHITGLREGHYKKEAIESKDLYNSATSGTLQGEGAAFVLLSTTPSAQTCCKVTGIDGLFRPTAQALRERLINFLASRELNFSDIDVWIAGFSGDVVRDQSLAMLADELLADVTQVRFKHLTGEYCTADGFALWLGANILKRQHIPECTLAKGAAPDISGKSIHRLLIVNHYLNQNYTFYLLERVVVR